MVHIKSQTPALTSTNLRPPVPSLRPWRRPLSPPSYVSPTFPNPKAPPNPIIPQHRLRRPPQLARPHTFPPHHPLVLRCQIPLDPRLPSLLRIPPLLSPKLLVPTSLERRTDEVFHSDHAILIFQRVSVMVEDLVLHHAIWRITKRVGGLRGIMICVLVIWGPGLLMVDHVHFRYNGMLLGVLVWSMGLLREGRDLMTGMEGFWETCCVGGGCGCGVCCRFWTVCVLWAVSCYSLFPLLFEPQEYPLKVLLLLLHSALMWYGFSSLFRGNKKPKVDKFSEKKNLGSKPERRSLPATGKDGFCIGWVGKAYLLGIVLVEVWGQFLQPVVLKDRLPFLPLLLISVYCTFGMMYSWLWQLKSIILLP
ncbi:putative dolichyl pyrophosphate Glc1Man9GlcNAc2 alpha-1,3-glucosyltransferase [Drosera capensis]